MSFDLFLNLSVLANTVAGVNNPAPTAVATEVAAREPFKNNFSFYFPCIECPSFEKNPHNTYAVPNNTGSVVLHKYHAGFNSILRS